MLARDMAATPVRNRSTSPPSSTAVTIRVDESPFRSTQSRLRVEDLPTRRVKSARLTASTDSLQSGAEAVIAQAQAKAQALRKASGKGTSDGLPTSWEDGGPSATPEAIVDSMGDTAVAMPGSKLSLRSNGSAATRPSYDKAMDRPGYMQGIAPRLPAPVREDSDQLSYAGTEATDLDAALGLPPSDSLISPQASYRRALGSAPISPGSLPTLDPPPYQSQAETMTPASVDRQDSYAGATMAQGLLSPGSLPRLLVAVPETGEDSAAASGHGHPPPVTAVPQLAKEGSYAVALGNAVSPGSLPTLTQREQDFGHESVV